MVSQLLACTFLVTGAIFFLGGGYSKDNWSCSLLMTLPPVLEALFTPTVMLQPMLGTDSVVYPVTAVHRFLLHFLTWVSWVRVKASADMSWDSPGPASTEYNSSSAAF